MAEISLTTKEAVEYVLREHELSKYSLAINHLKVRPIMINNYLNGTRMGEETATRFKDIFGIIITDVFKRGKA